MVNILGLVQGAVDEAVFYSFYKPGFAVKGLSLVVVDGMITENFFRPQSADLLTAVHDLRTLAEFNYFPNPVAAGQIVTLNSDINIGTGSSFGRLKGTADI